MVKIWKWLKLLNSVPFIIKTSVNHVYNWVWSFELTFTVLQWMKNNCEISQFSKFLLRSRYVILVKIWKWLKLLHSVPFFKKPRVDKSYGDRWFHLSPRRWPFFTNLGLGLSSKVFFLLIFTQFYELAFLTKCWLFQTRNPPLSLFMVFWLLYFHNFCSNTIWKVAFKLKRQAKLA